MYFPWPGFFSHIALADVLIWLDDAQFSKGSFFNRIQVLLKDKVHWMTIPLEGHGSFQKINELKPGKKDWVNQHRSMLQQSFKNKELGNISLSLFDEVTNLSKQQKLSKTLISSCEVLASYLQVLPPNVIVSSDINVGGKSSERVLQLVKSVSGTRYLTGHGASKYLDHELFEKAGVEVEYIDYQIGEWPQEMSTFTPFVTSLDLIASLPIKLAKQRMKSISKNWCDFIK